MPSFDIAIAAKMSIEKCNPSTIVELKLENMKLTPQMLDVCAANLEALILRSVDIDGTLDFSKFPKLQILKLIHCGLSTVEKLPKNLKLLNISSNPSKNFQNSFGLYQIRNVTNVQLFLYKNTQRHSKTHKHSIYFLCTSLVEDIDFLTKLPKLETLRIGYAKRRINLVLG